MFSLLLPYKNGSRRLQEPKCGRWLPSNKRLRADAPPHDPVISTFDRQEIGARFRAKIKENRECERLHLSKPESYWLD